MSLLPSCLVPHSFPVPLFFVYPLSFLPLLCTKWNYINCRPKHAWICRLLRNVVHLYRIAIQLCQIDHFCMPTHRFLARSRYAMISERRICRDSLDYSHLNRACRFLGTKRKLSRYVRCDYDLCSCHIQNFMLFHFSKQPLLYAEQNIDLNGCCVFFSTS